MTVSPWECGSRTAILKRVKLPTAIVCLLALLAAACADTESDREVRLIRAARNGESKTITAMLDAGADIETRNPGDSWTPLMWAAARDQSACVKLLVARGAKLEAADPHGMTALMGAARWGKKEGVAALLDSGARIGATDRSGWNALMWAAFKGQTEMVALLLDRGAQLEGRDPAGRTPLMLAAMKGRDKTVDLLLARGASAAVRDSEGHTAAELAAADGYADLAKRLRGAPGS